ncbi:PREDICTED: uncharacterized protein LOC109184161 [Ipomoea nil]|uniref:uncharacterized protein LOC109184161 n=1 Tax=Ipomoea nil TaxID=35883 RepID=UPI0009016649|nr:PREDICTED: uncharacterized protein LOC109184161 [Ipomoea nil]
MASSFSTSLSNSAVSSVAQAPTLQPKEEQEEVTSVTAKEELEGKVKVMEEFDRKPVKKSPIELLEEAQNEKFKRYEAEYTQHLMSKYFSDKTIFGGNIFDVKMTIDGEAIKVSRFPGYLSYADPANFQDESSSSSPNSAVETPSCSANGNPPSKNGN